MKILTALNNREIYNELKNEFEDSNEYKILNKDIIYKEGVLEFLNNNSDINVLILNINIDGNIEVFDLIKKILEINKYIEIIAILKKEDIEIRKFLSSYNISKILIENNFTFNDLLKNITNNNQIKQKSIEKELEDLRKLIFNKEENTLKNKFKKIIRKFKEDKEKKKINKNINKRKEVKKQKKNKENINNTKDNTNKIDNRIYFTLSENIQKYNISSIDITIKIKK